MQTRATSERQIVIIKTGEPVPRVKETRGEFSDLIAQAIGPAWQGGYAVADVLAGDLPDPRSAAAFVITGSAANVPTREPWMRRTEAWLREVVALGTPTFGICFGHQILAQALGGLVEKNPRGREMGSVPIERVEHDPLFEGLPDRFLANVTHVDSVVRLPPGAAALARSEREDYQAIRFSETCYGVQFHPEIDREVMRAYVETRRAILEGEGFDVDAMLAGAQEGEAGRQALRNFVRRL